MASTTELSKRLHAELGSLIAELAPGERLLSEPKLAQQFGVSRATLREAMRTYETQGLIQRRQGVGTFVVRPGGVMEAGLEVLESIETMAERSNLPVSMGDFSIDRRPASEEEARALQSKRVVEIGRVIESEGRPVASLTDVIAADLLSERQLSREFTGSVLDLLLRSGELELSSSKTEIHALAADSEVARALRIQRGDVILGLRATLFTTDGTVVDLSRSNFLPGYFRFHVVRRVGQL